MNTTTLIGQLNYGEYDDMLFDIYGDKTDYQRSRYINAIRMFEKYYGADEISVFSAPGRSEIGGNHTDHQHGEVLAASINSDTIAIVKCNSDNCIKVISEGYEEIVISLDELTYKPDERGSTIALIKGVLSGIKERGYRVGGFSAYVTSDVLIGAGLSSSAAFETLIGTIVSGLFNNMEITATEIAVIGQYAENTFFGKPCGLMDQMACSVGNLVHIDFANPQNPIVEKVEFDMNGYGYSLCITDTKGSHSDLTADYAAIPQEMKRVANYFGQEVLLGITTDDIINAITPLRETAGDRSVLRTLHFITENERVKKEVRALREGDIDRFLKLIKESGNSSFKYLQNVYSGSDVEHQKVSLALAVSDIFLGEQGASRVHGGGFAGTIQAFVKNNDVEAYRKHMDSVFGKGACVELNIRKYGGIKLI